VALVKKVHIHMGLVKIHFHDFATAVGTALVKVHFHVVRCFATVTATGLLKRHFHVVRGLARC
jgi:hypothetical protein